MKAYVKDLVVVVGGKQNGDGMVTINSSHITGRTGPISALKQSAGVKKALTTLVKKGKDRGIEAAVRKTKEVRPDQVIPMEEGDFKQF
jgi:hypothetical protein